MDDSQLRSSVIKSLCILITATAACCSWICILCSGAEAHCRWRCFFFPTAGWEVSESSDPLESLGSSSWSPQGWFSSNTLGQLLTTSNHALFLEINSTYNSPKSAKHSYRIYLTLFCFCFFICICPL